MNKTKTVSKNALKSDWGVKVHTFPDLLSSSVHSRIKKTFRAINIAQAGNGILALTIEIVRVAFPYVFFSTLKVTDGTEDG